MVPEKGPDCFAALAGLVPGPRFLAFGDGPERAAAEAAAGGRVEFRGAVPGMAGHWAEVGLLAITSRAEGLPLAALEAMAAGVPVAAFALGGLPELVTDGVDGWLAPPDDLPALAAKVAAWAALDGAARDAIGAAARATIAARFGREAGVARLAGGLPPGPAADAVAGRMDAGGAAPGHSRAGQRQGECMAEARMVLQIGMGTDIRGGEPTKAAVRALRDALWHNSLTITHALGVDVDSMRVR